MPMVNAAVHLRRLMLLYLSGFLFFCDPVWAVESSVFDISSAVLGAQAGETLNLPPGRFRLRKPLTVTQENLVIKGAGAQHTVLDFGGTTEGGQGVLVRASGVILDGFTILDAPGDGVVARGVNNLVISNLRVGWQKRRPGGYGIYPVQCRNVIVKDSEVFGASEAGIYIGQTSLASIDGNYVYRNIIGIDIENSTSVTVRNNSAKGNSIGISVTGRPYLFLKNAQRIRLLDNVLEDNNLINFSPGDFVSKLGSGAGIVITASQGVRLLGNRFSAHRLSDIVVIKFGVLDVAYESDAGFDATTRDVKIGLNKFQDAGKAISVVSEFDSSDFSPGSSLAFIGYKFSEVGSGIACFDQLDNTLARFARFELKNYLIENFLRCNPAL